MNSYLRLPGVEEKLAKIFPNMTIFGTHWFQGEKAKAEYSGWHTGIVLFISNSYHYNHKTFHFICSIIIHLFIFFLLFLAEYSGWHTAIIQYYSNLFYLVSFTS